MDRDIERDENEFSLGPDDFEILLNAYVDMSTIFAVYTYFGR